MKINDLDEGFLDFFGLGDKGEPIPQPSWLSDENAAIWNEKQPTTSDTRFVTQYKGLKRFIDAGLTDDANMVVSKELSMLDR